MPIRCLIVDDNGSFLASAKRLLESEGLDVVGAVSTGAEAVGLASRVLPDVALVDLELGEENGFELARRLTSLPEAVPVVLISTHPETDVVDLVAASPAVGFVPKSDLSAEAVRRCLATRSRGR